MALFTYNRISVYLPLARCVSPKLRRLLDLASCTKSNDFGATIFKVSHLSISRLLFTGVIDGLGVSVTAKVGWFCSGVKESRAASFLLPGIPKCARWTSTFVTFNTSDVTVCG